MNSRDNVLLGVQAASAYLKAQGVKPRRRDRREPGRKEKEQMEARIAAIMRRIFRKQKANIRQRLEVMYSERKALIQVPVIGFMDDWETEDEAALIKALLDAVRGGVMLFGAGAIPGIDEETVFAEALAFVRHYFYDTFKEELTKTTIQALEKGLTSFISTPGYTIGNLMDDISSLFGAARAERIAITEVTRAYASGQRIAGEEMRKEYPDIQLVKEWLTNNDEKVCDICMPLHGLIVPFEDKYSDAYDISQPPAHINCRCWQVVNTNVGGGMEPTVG